jgi:hypothetical protein
VAFAAAALIPISSLPSPVGPNTSPAETGVAAVGLADGFDDGGFVDGEAGADGGGDEDGDGEDAGAGGEGDAVPTGPAWPSRSRRQV